MKKKHMLRTGLLLAAFCLALTSCNSSGPSDDPPDPGEETLPKYLSVDRAPVYADVDETVYTTYYFDSVSGSDENTGTDESSPKRTVSAAQALIESAGDTPTQLLFKAGCEFDGKFTITGHTAAEETPLIVSSYGVTEAAPYPIFTGEADTEIMRIEAPNTRITGLEFTGAAATRAILIYSGIAGAFSNIVIADNYMHDINFNWTLEDAPEEADMALLTEEEVQKVCPDSRSGYGTGGIGTSHHSSELIGPTWFENMWISGNVIERVARGGMFLSAGWARRPGWEWGANKYHSDEVGYYPNRNVYVVGNTVRYTGGDGIVLLHTDGGYIEGNTVYHAQFLGRNADTSGQAAYNVAIWSHSCNNVVYQYNEAAYTHKRNNAGDGQGFDIDIGNRNIIFRYNYSHHNEGGGILICNRSVADVFYNADGTKITDEDGLPVMERRYTQMENINVLNNVFAYNDLWVFNIAGPSDGLKFFNNTVLLDGERQTYLLFSEDMANTGVPAKNWTFSNNIFWQAKKQTVLFDEAWCQSWTAENNLFYNFNDTFFDDFNNDYRTEIATYFTFDPQLSTTEAADGIACAGKIVARNPQVYTSGRYEDGMMCADINGNDAEGIRYLGAVAKV